MIIEEVINNPNYTSAVECDNAFEMKIIVNGYTSYYKPVDFRLNKINIPLKSNDIDIIYDKLSRESKVFKDNVITKWYYPPSTHITLTDGTELIVLKYGPIKYYNGLPRMDCYCKLANENGKLIETIPNKPVINKVLKEVNNILISNDELKRHLPKYNANWILYNDTQADDATESAAHRKLDKIAHLEYQEMYSIQNDIKSTFDNTKDETVSIPETVLNEINQFSIDFTKKRYQICYDNVVKMFRMRAIANWLLYIEINKDYSIDHRHLYILNAFREYMNIEATISNNPVIGSDIIYTFTLPDESLYDYRIQLYQVSENQKDYVSYNIDDVRVFKIFKETEDETEIELQDQNDFFDTFVSLIEILSADVSDQLMANYYAGIPVMIEQLTPESRLDNNDTDLDNDGEESMEQEIIRYINNTIDKTVTETTDRKIKETITSHILAGNGNVQPIGDEEDVVVDDDNTTSDNNEPIDEVEEIMYDAGGSSF